MIQKSLRNQVRECIEPRSKYRIFVCVHTHRSGHLSNGVCEKNRQRDPLHLYHFLCYTEVKR